MNFMPWIPETSHRKGLGPARKISFGGDPVLEKYLIKRDIVVKNRKKPCDGR